MAMSLIWTVMVGAAILCGLATGNGPAVAKGALDGAAAGVGPGVVALWGCPLQADNAGSNVKTANSTIKFRFIVVSSCF